MNRLFEKQGCRSPGNFARSHADWLFYSTNKERKQEFSAPKMHIFELISFMPPSQHSYFLLRLNLSKYHPDLCVLFNIPTFFLDSTSPNAIPNSEVEPLVRPQVGEGSTPLPSRVSQLKSASSRDAPSRKTEMRD
jgi:hypothetical protein